MSKKQSEDLTNDVLIADVLLRITTMEALLISKGVCTREEYDSLLQEIAGKIAKSILKSASVPGNLDELINSLKGKKSNIESN